MSTHRDNFDSWYKKMLELLYPHRDAGFPILLITFPLLERYLRQKTGLASDEKLSDGFFDELTQIFPVLTSRVRARNLWQIYRNGLVHEITFSHQARSGVLMPTGSRINSDQAQFDLLWTRRAPTRLRFRKTDKRGFAGWLRH